MEDLKTKAGLQRIPVDYFTISSTEVAKYFTDTILGVSSGVKFEFTRWTGISSENNYVRMRVVMQPNIVIKSDKPTYQGERILREFASSVDVRSDLNETLKPYKYPEINSSDIANLQRLMIQGLSSERLAEINRWKDLVYIPETNLFGIYLRPERIIGDMISDPDSDEERTWSIEAVRGTTSETIRWIVAVDRGCKSVIGSDMNFNAFFRT